MYIIVVFEFIVVIFILMVFGWLVIGYYRFCKYVCSLEFDLSNFFKVIMILVELRMLLIFDVVVWSLFCIDIYILYNVF